MAADQVPTLGTVNETLTFMTGLSVTHDGVAVEWDRGWGDDTPVISVTAEGQGRKPRAFVTDKVYGELLDQNLIAGNSFRVLTDRRLHTFGHGDQEGDPQ
jgi:hypothetical protein